MAGFAHYRRIKGCPESDWRTRVSENESPVLSDEGRLAFYREQAKGLKGDDINYHGLRMHAVEGLHDMVGDIAIAEFPKGAEVLDVASGSGAMCLRLQEAAHQIAASG